MSGARLWRRQVFWEQKAYWRNPAAAAFTFAFPLMFLVVFIAINGNAHITTDGGHRIRFAQFYVPAIIAFGLISACYTNLAFTITNRRESGQLKRVRGTPLSPTTYLGGIFGHVVVVAVVLSALVMALGLIAYDVTWPGHYLPLVVGVVLGAFCFGALGVLVSTFAPNEDAAPAIINFALFPLLFISGTFGPVSDTSVLGRIASIFPIYHLNRMIIDAFDPFRAGSLRWIDVAVLVAWGIGATWWSIRRFRWEPRSR